MPVRLDFLSSSGCAVRRFSNSFFLGPRPRRSTVTTRSSSKPPASDTNVIWTGWQSLSTGNPNCLPCSLSQKAASPGKRWKQRPRYDPGEIRQDSVSASALAQAPGGYRSPQLAALLSQLQWISISGKPEGNFLRVVIDGESTSEATVHQLKEVLSGIVVLAQTGLNEAQTRKQLDPQLRQSYLDLLQSTDIQQINRSNSKSVRVVFEVTPKLLEAPRGAAPVADPPPATRKPLTQTPVGTPKYGSFGGLSRPRRRSSCSATD